MDENSCDCWCGKNPQKLSMTTFFKTNYNIPRNQSIHIYVSSHQGAYATQRVIGDDTGSCRITLHALEKVPGLGTSRRVQKDFSRAKENNWRVAQMQAGIPWHVGIPMVAM